MQKWREKNRVHLRQQQRKNCTYYRKETPHGFLMFRYAQIKTKLKDVTKYKHLSLLSRNDFLTWAKTDSQFQYLFDVWRQSGHQHKLNPSVDRIDSKLGYEIGNMQWLTLQQNVSKGRKIYTMNAQTPPVDFQI